PVHWHQLHRPAGRPSYSYLGIAIRERPRSHPRWPRPRRRGHLMTALGTYDTDVSDMYAVHRALLGALDAAPQYIAKAGPDSERVEVIGSFLENVIEFLHVHHSGEDELIYPVLEQRCAESLSELKRIDDQH